MLPEKSLFFYGRPYHLVFDQMNRYMRQRILERVPEDSTVLDLGCGTGELALMLRATKSCRVAGFDLSQKMIDFAQRRNPFPEVAFGRADAVAVIGDLPDDAYDVAVVSQFLHEIAEEQQVAILKGMARVARMAVFADWNPPLPVAGPGAIGRLIEASVGRDHRARFLAYLESGGIVGLLEKAGLAGRVSEKVTYNRGTGLLVTLGRD
jgi:ubiquinone/menaquinone biosynthesis C-methylase UbiE